jgi:hypothetical protein
MINSFVAINAWENTIAKREVHFGKAAKKKERVYTAKGDFLLEIIKL